MIVYRYLLFEYLKVLGLCLVSFIAILLTTRLEDIAYFASLGGKSWTILKFVLLQIPYILPIVLPIASLVSGIVLTLRLSQTQELTALRASGLSIWNILSPVLITAAFLSIANFALVSEVATESVLQTRLLQREMTLVNPLTLIQQKNLIRHRDLYVTAANPALSRNAIEGAAVAIWNQDARRISLVTAEELSFDEPLIRSKNLTLFSSFNPNQRNQYDNLYLENIADSSMDVEGFSLYLKHKATRLNDDYLRMGLLLSYIDSLKHKLTEGEFSTVDKDIMGQKLTKARSEIIRRFSMGLTVFSLTLLGASFGITTSRQPSFRNSCYVIGLASLLLTCIFAAKAAHGQLWLAAGLYFIPESVIIALSVWNVNRVSRGKE